MSGTLQAKPRKSFIRQVVRIIVGLLAVLLAGILILTAVLFIISPGKPTPFLDSDGSIAKNSISEKIRVDINGAEQGMFIRGRDIANPVILFVHGGPGMPEYFLAEKYKSVLEDSFTVCYWEQRGGGLSYTKGMSGDSITTAQLVDDTLAVTDYLRDRFGQDKIYLLAHSWGTFIGIRAAEKAPELFSAYIGMAQVVNTAESEKQAYQYMMAQYEAAGDTKMLNKLKAYPILDSDAVMIPYFKSMLRDQTMHALGIGTMRDMKSVVTGIFLPVFGCRAYTLGEKVTVWRAKAFLRSDTVLLDELFSTDMSVEVPKLEVPVYFFTGSHDYTVSSDLTRQYFETLQAPEKGLYIFENSAHTPMFEEPEKFVQIMREDVLEKSFGLADQT
jgi:pimeloyl-ACP methyl ester carboxylesterase